MAPQDPALDPLLALTWAARAHDDDQARHRDRDPAAAQPGGAGQAGRDPRRAVRRPVHARRRRWLSRTGVPRDRRQLRRARRGHRRVPRRDAGALVRRASGVPRPVRRASPASTRTRGRCSGRSRWSSAGTAPRPTGAPSRARPRLVRLLADAAQARRVLAGLAAGRGAGRAARRARRARDHRDAARPDDAPNGRPSSPRSAWTGSCCWRRPPDGAAQTIEAGPGGRRRPVLTAPAHRLPALVDLGAQPREQPADGSQRIAAADQGAFDNLPGRVTDPPPRRSRRLAAGYLRREQSRRRSAAHTAAAAQGPIGRRRA